MTAFASSAERPTYCNPVFNQSFPDPFVLKFGGEYFAYCTGFWKDGNVFGVLRSTDLVNWKEIGGAMRPLPNDAPYYWAPEVTYHNGRFYLYYSVGNEILMEIRLAVSESPEGGFVHVGDRLTFEEFAIDPHVFLGRDGTRYMFYATDFLEHTHIGTGTVVDRMIDWQKLEGNPRPVTRAKYDWQVYDPQRKEKGGVRWHTVEGPFVLERKGRYFQMFSGGNWQNTTYGVSFATSNKIVTDGEWEQHSDGEQVLPVLRTIPERIIGPGHNSVVAGPNNRELYCVYHRWTEGGRVLSIDRMDFAGDRIFVAGATDTPQPAPFAPSVTLPSGAGVADESVWETEGNWSLSGNAIECAISEKSFLRLKNSPSRFLCRFDLAVLKTVNGGSAGIYLEAGGKTALELSLLPNMRQAAVLWTENGEMREEVFGIAEIDAAVPQTLQIEADGRLVRCSLSGTAFRTRHRIERFPDQLALFAKACGISIAGFALTEGFEELFEGDEKDLEACGWLINAENAEIRSGEFQFSGGGRVGISKPGAYSDLDIAVNLRLIEEGEKEVAYGVLLADAGRTELEFGIDAAAGSLYVACAGSRQQFDLPAGFTPSEFCQLRILRLSDSATLYIDGQAVTNLQVGRSELGFEVFGSGSPVGVDMVRLTDLRTRSR